MAIRQAYEKLAVWGLFFNNLGSLWLFGEGYRTIIWLNWDSWIIGERIDNYSIC
jgi:hypothetical protein